jgi:hypothetical protein
MCSKQFGWVLVALTLGLASARADGPPAATLPTESDFLVTQGKGANPPGKEPAPPAKEPAPSAPQPEADPFAQAPSPSGETPTGSNPRMIGDFPAYFGLSVKFITPPSSSALTSSSSSSSSSSLSPAFFRTPIVSAGAFKVAENESPQPQDRVFVTYNFFSSIQAPEVRATQTIPAVPAQTITTPAVTVPGPPGLPAIVIPGTSVTIPGTPAQVVPVLTVPAPVLDVHREVFGFEKTFLDGYVSVGLRMPVQQIDGDDDNSREGFGDLSILLKCVLLGDPRSDRLVSAGLMVTAPTGPSAHLTSLDNPDADIVIHPTLLQPFTGYLWGDGDFYLHGFLSVVVPTDARDVTLLFNDVGVGYWMYRSSEDRLLTSVVPTLEAHVTTPLNHRSATDLITVPDIVALTGGVHLGLGEQSMLTLGVATPVTGPRPFDVEAIVQFNWRF